jgi:hypothetical protein
LAAGFESTRPTLPPSVPQYFIPVRGTTDSPVVYRAMLLGVASARFVDAKARVDVTQSLVLITPITDSAVPIDWLKAEEPQLDPDDLERQPAGGAEFAPLPAAAAQPRNYPLWQKDLVAAIYSSRTLTLLRSARCNQLSRIDETEGEFRVRLNQAAREQRDASLARLRAKYAPKTAAIHERLRRAEQAVARESGQARSATLATALSFGSTLLGAFLGRRVVSATNISKAATALKGVGRSVEQAQDVARAGETVDALKQQLTELDEQFQAEAASVAAETDAGNEPLERTELRLNKANIAVKLVALAWTPHRRDAAGNPVSAY